MKKVVADVKVKGYTHHASKEEPQYFIKSDKSDHVAIHKSSALRQLKSPAPKGPDENIPKAKNEKLSLSSCRPARGHFSIYVFGAADSG